jgi:hypothetical protein
MTLKHNNLKYPRMTEMLGEVDGSAKFGLMPWTARCAVEYIKENCKTSWVTSKELDLDEDVWFVSDGTLQEAATHYKTVSQEALDVGSAVHEAIEVYFRDNQRRYEWPNAFSVGQLFQAANALCAFFEWEAKHELKTRRTEHRLWMKDWCGMLDWYGDFDDKRYIIDWKSSKTLYHKDRVQVAGYRWAMTEKGYTVDGHGVLRLDKESGEFEWRDYSKFYERDVEEFKLIHDLYMIRHPIIAGQFKED